ncbi:UNVERIFIED_CONTAM: hypothetical protein RMT77_012514 [Armadillidium vulgare]
MDLFVNLGIIIAFSSVYIYINILSQSSTNACFRSYYKLIHPHIEWVSLPSNTSSSNGTTNCTRPFFWLYYKCILVINERLDYNDSMKACKSLGANLLIPHYPHAIMSYLLRNHGIERFWFRKFKRIRFYYEGKETLWTKEILVDFLVNSRPEECPVISRYEMGSEECDEKNGYICSLKIEQVKESIKKATEEELIKHHTEEYFDFSKNPAKFGEPDTSNLSLSTGDEYYSYVDYYAEESQKKTVPTDYPLYPEDTTPTTKELVNVTTKFPPKGTAKSTDNVTEITETTEAEIVTGYVSVPVIDVTVPKKVTSYVSTPEIVTSNVSTPEKVTSNVSVTEIVTSSVSVSEIVSEEFTSPNTTSEVQSSYISTTEEPEVTTKSDKGNITEKPEVTVTTKSDKGNITEISSIEKTGSTLIINRTTTTKKPIEGNTTKTSSVREGNTTTISFASQIQTNQTNPLVATTKESTSTTTNESTSTTPGVTTTNESTSTTPGITTTNEFTSTTGTNTTRMSTVSDTGSTSLTSEDTTTT